MIPNAKYQARIDSGNAVVYAHIHDGTLSEIGVSIYTETTEQALALAAEFPKSVGVRATTLSGHEYDGDYGRDENNVFHMEWVHSWRCGVVAWRAYLSTDGVNKGRNESGLKRYRSLHRHLGRLGIAAEYDTEAAVRTHELNRVEDMNRLDTLIGEYEA